MVFNMATVIHIIKPQRASLFGDYTEMQLLPYLESQMSDSTTRMDAVWDMYTETSLKSQTRAKWGETTGRRTRVSAKIPLPKGAEWQKFLKDSQNKEHFFQFISQELQRKTTDAQFHLLTTKTDLELSNKPIDLSVLSPCQQEDRTHVQRGNRSQPQRIADLLPVLSDPLRCGTGPLPDPVEGQRCPGRMRSTVDGVP